MTSFGPRPVAKAHGAILAHSVVADGTRIAKGRVLDADDVARLTAADIETVTVATLGGGDVIEDAAAARVAAALEGRGVVADTARTGRCNLHAAHDGLFLADARSVGNVNAVDEGITLATLPNETVVKAGRMVATVKIIPLAVPDDQASAAARAGSEGGHAVVSVAPFRPLDVAMVSTTLPQLKNSVIDKTERRFRERLDRLGSRLVWHQRAPHQVEPLADLLSRAKADLVCVFAASAMVDRADVVPAAIRAAGGGVEVVGMPVDPGNLLCVGRLADMPVIGAPGCARAPAENGFDWVLHRLAAGQPVTRDWVSGLGVGGLLMEIHSRPSPRGGELAVAVLAAGRSSRMGQENKLTRSLNGRPLVVHAVDAALEAEIGPVHVVTGHEAELVEGALAGRDLRFVRNADFADGMSTSLRAAADAAGDARGLMVLLGDMPDLSPGALQRLVAAFREHDGQRIVAARDRATGRRGNPVVWPRGMFDALKAIDGDRGARDVLLAGDPVLVEVEGAALDLDTPEAFRERQGA